MPEQKWLEAKQHFDEIYQQYESLMLHPGVNTTFAINAVLNPLKERYETGERTKELFDNMMRVE